MEFANVSDRSTIKTKADKVRDLINAGVTDTKEIINKLSEQGESINYSYVMTLKSEILRQKTPNYNPQKPEEIPAIAYELGRKFIKKCGSLSIAQRVINSLVDELQANEKNIKLYKESLDRIEELLKDKNSKSERNSLLSQKKKYTQLIKALENI